MEKQTPKDIILGLIKEKAILKQNVFKQTVEIFKDFKLQAETLIKELQSDISKIDDSIPIDYYEKGDFEFHIKFGGDVLVFYMHTNVFDFPKDHYIWNSSYIKENELRSYCGVINVYNFLSDSFKYNRINDVGYLVARCFINNEKHYFVEGKRQLGVLYNDFIQGIITKEKIKSIIESTIIYSMDFDLLTPPYDNMKELSVYEIIEVSNAMRVKTGKRLGFKFQADNDFE